MYGPQPLKTAGVRLWEEIARDALIAEPHADGRPGHRKSFTVAYYQHVVKNVDRDLPSILDDVIEPSRDIVGAMPRITRSAFVAEPIRNGAHQSI